MKGVGWGQHFRDMLSNYVENMSKQVFGMFVPYFLGMNC